MDDAVENLPNSTLTLGVMALGKYRLLNNFLLSGVRLPNASVELSLLLA